MRERYEVDVELPPNEALEAVARAAEAWGAVWTPGRGGGELRLPLLAGLKYGLLTGRVDIEPEGLEGGGGSSLLFAVEESRFRLRWSALAILALGGIGGIAATLWPFFPVLIGIAPLAIVVAIGAWVLVVSRLRTSTAEEFFELVADEAERSPES